MSSFVSVPIELAIFNKNDQILLTYREDEEYQGFHMPGTVLQNNETVPNALERLFNTEIKGLKLSEPKSIGWLEINKGSGEGKNNSRHEISLLHQCMLIEPDNETKYNFFELSKLPENTLPHHSKIIREMITKKVT